MKKKSRRSKTDLLAIGLDILSEYGEGELTIDFLCQKLGVTKGSFYHHFKSRDLFSRELLLHWEKEQTEKFIAACEKSDSAEERYRTLTTIVMDINDEAEIAVRAWALRDPMAKEIQERVDNTRIAYLHTLYTEMTGDVESASILAQLEYATFIGARQIVPRPDKKRIAQLIEQWTKLVNQYLKGGAQ